MRRCFIALLLLASCAAPGAPSPGSPAPGIAGPGGVAPGGATLGQMAAEPSTDARLIGSLPETFSEMRRDGAVTDYEAQRPGLGASARYLPVNGERILVTLYSYDRGQRRQPEGGGSPDVMAELRLTGGELDGMVRLGRYRSSTFVSDMNVSSGNDPVSLRCATYRLVQGDGAPTGDAVCVTVWNGRFLKSRVTMWNPAEPNVAGVMASLLLVEMRKNLTGVASQRVTMRPVESGARLVEAPAGMVPPTGAMAVPREG